MAKLKIFYNLFTKGCRLCLRPKDTILSPKQMAISTKEWSQTRFRFEGTQNISLIFLGAVLPVDQIDINRSLAEIQVKPNELGNLTNLQASPGQEEILA